MSVLCVADLSVEYRLAEGGLTALDNVSFELNAGERLAILGESGSGKSTMALAIAGLLPQDAKTIGVINWNSTGKPPRPGHDLGFVFQNAMASFDPLVRIGRQLEEIRRALSDDRAAQAKSKVLEMLGAVGLEPEWSAYNAYPHQLSGGQAQRAAIAAALIGSPSLLIADEPTSALDTIIQRQILGLISSISGREKLSLLFITHDLAVASAIADRVAVMREGRLVATGAFADIFAAPKDPYLQQLKASYLKLLPPTSIKRT